MEFLNNLWVAISTPNEALINFIAIPGSIIENLLIMLLFTSILNISATKRQKIIYVFSMSCICLFMINYVEGPYNLFINYIIAISFVYAIFKKSLFKTIVTYIISLILLNLAGTLLLNPYITIMHIDTVQLSIIPLYRLFYTFIMYLLCIIIILFLKYKNLKLDFLEDIDKKDKFIILSNLFFGIVALVVQMIILFYYVDKLPILITSFSFIALLAYFIISI